MIKLVSVKTSQLDEIDRQLLHALIVAPRASFRVLAAALGVSDQTVARRFRRLVETADLRVTGLVHGPRAGWVDWMVRLQVAPGSAQRIADSLAMVGPTNIFRAIDETFGWVVVLGADQLRSFLAIIVFGSFTKATERVRRHSSNCRNRSRAPSPPSRHSARDQGRRGH